MTASTRWRRFASSRRATSKNNVLAGFHASWVKSTGNRKGTSNPWVCCMGRESVQQISIQYGRGGSSIGAYLHLFMYKGLISIREENPRPVTDPSFTGNPSRFGQKVPVCLT